MPLKWMGFCLSLLSLWCLGAVSLAAQTLPAATASTSANLSGVGIIAGGTGHIAANSVGDVFYIGQTDNTLYRVPRGTTTPIAIVTGLSGARNAFVDPSNNLYTTSTYGGTIVEVPYINGTYASGIATGSLSACTSFNPVSPCLQASPGALLSYYYQPLDLGMDATGTLYVLNVYANGACSGSCLVKFTRGATTYNAATLVESNVFAQNYNAELAVTPNGDAYLATGSGTTVYYIASGTTSAVQVGTFTNPSGVSSDKLGNVYVTNSSSPYEIYQFPAVNNVAQPNQQYAYINTYANKGVGIDGLGDIFYTGYNSGTNLNVAHVNAIPLGSSNPGTPVSTSPTSVMFTFSGSSTLGGISANGAAFQYLPGSCAATATYAAGTSCTVNVNYTPTAVGVQRGAISLTSSTGSSLSTALLSGIGNGAQQTNDPGTLTSIGSGYTTPQAVQVDDVGNVFVADAGQNAVVRYAAGTGTPTSIGAGLSKPSSVAIDGAGNVFIADAGNGRIVEVPNVNGTLSNAAQTVIGSGLGSTLAIALDRYGNLYIADGASKKVTKYPSIGGAPSSAYATTVGSGFTLPIALATDATGNLFVADYAASSITEISYYGLIQTQVGAGLSNPTGMATDASGSLYVADSGNNRLLKIPLEGTAFNTNDQYLVGSGITTPYGVGIDSAANLYVTDVKAQTVSKLNRTAGTLALRAEVNSSTAPTNAYIGNAGNTALTLGTPAYTEVSATPTYFAVAPASNNGCTAGAAISAGYACILDATFAAPAIGTYSDVLTFVDSATNSPSTLTITGSSVNLAPTTTTVTQTAPSGTASFGSSVTIQAAVKSTVAGTPTGNVTFSVDGSPLTNPPSVSNGVASVVLTGLTGGQHTITATYTGDSTYGPSYGNLTITVAKASSTTALALNLTSTKPASASPGDSITLTATVTPGTSTAATGTVTFSVNGTTLNTVALNSSTGIAVLTTKALPAGNDTVTATYNGDVNYSSSSGSSSLLVTYPTFTLTPSASTITVTSGQTGTTTLTATALANFSGAYPNGPGAIVGLTCTGLPANSACAFNPNGVLLFQNSPQPITVQIVTGMTPAVPQPVTGSIGLSGKGRLGWLFALAGLSPLLLVTRRRATGKLLRRSITAALLVVLAGSSLSFSGCSNSGLIGVTPKGTYTVTVSAAGTMQPYTGSTAGTAAGCKVVPIQTQYSGIQQNLTCTPTATITLVVN